MTTQSPAHLVRKTIGRAATEANLKRTRRGVVAAASAVTILSSVSGASGQDRAGGVADQRDFEGALRAALARGEVLNWTGGNVRLKRPIAIDITQSST
jgi:hypothetical protein